MVYWRQVSDLVVLLPRSISHRFGNNGDYVSIFQMSFAATLALIAGYERGAVRLKTTGNSSLSARAALWGVNEMVGLTLASLLAGLATTPYAAYHFHRIAPYGVIANLLAMPVVSAWVMPMGILGVITMPFGLDAECWRQMGYGLQWMDAVALGVAGLPGAYEPDAFEEDCSRAALVIAHRDPPQECAATVIKRELWRARGAMALRHTASGFVIESARSQNFDRPWSPALQPRSRSDEAVATSTDGAAPKLAPRDATPKQDDIEADQ
jgi:hypothetical protein